jgi:hypothetical protein
VRANRPLIACLLAAVALNGCNGNGLESNSTGVTPGPFYMSGKADVGASTGQIGFFTNPTGVSADPFDLVVIDPASTKVNKLAPGGSWLPMASVSQWTSAASGGTASNWAPRFLVYAQQSAGSLDAPLYLVDLGRTSSSAVPTAGTRFSTASTIASNICTFGQASGLVLNDYGTPSNSWVTLRVAGPDNSCNTLDNQTIAIPLSGGATFAPADLGLVEPVEAIHDATGKLTGAVELVHILASQVGTTPPSLQVADAGLHVQSLIGTSQAMLGTGNTSANGDFQSLGVAIGSGFFLYRDAASVMGINLASPAVAITLFTLATTLPADQLQSGRALFDSDGATAYVAVNNPGGTSYIVRISTASSVPVATRVVTDAAAASIQLVGLTAPTGYLVYQVGGTGGLRAVPKAMSNSTTPLSVATLSATQVFDAEPAIVLGDAVRYTIDDRSGNYRQLYSATFSSGGVSAPTAFVAAGGGCTVMIRGVYANPVSTIATPTYGSALLASGSGFCSSTDAALQFSSAALAYVDSNGTVSAAGQLPTLAAQNTSPPPANAATALRWVDANYFFGDPGGAAPVDGPLQAGVPALLELDGATAQSVTAIDIETFTLGATTPPVRLTNNLQ